MTKSGFFRVYVNTFCGISANWEYMLRACMGVIGRWQVAGCRQQGQSQFSQESVGGKVMGLQVESLNRVQVGCWSSTERVLPLALMNSVWNRPQSNAYYQCTNGCAAKMRKGFNALGTSQESENSMIIPWRIHSLCLDLDSSLLISISIAKTDLSELGLYQFQGVAAQSVCPGCGVQYSDLALFLERHLCRGAVKILQQPCQGQTPPRLLIDRSRRIITSDAQQCKGLFYTNY